MLGRYALYQQLASGGIGSVCLARMRAEVGFARIMAVKRLHPHHAKDPQFVTMFLDEARMAARVRHPNVVPVLDVVADDDELFLVMEYVVGESLARLLSTARERSSPVEPAITVAIMSGVLEGLNAAHLATNERGIPLNIVHRDVSPQNVLVGTEGVARLVDFGVAKAAGRLQESTQAGQVKGKLLYMPPEQFANSKLADRRSDVWSAALVLWEMLAGRTMFVEAVEAIRYHTGLLELVPPSEVGGSGVLDAVVMKGLARNPDDRYQTAREMLVAMERAVSPAPARRVGQWVQKLAREALNKRAAYVEEIEADAARASANHVAARQAGSEPRPAIATDETLLAAVDRSSGGTAATAPRSGRVLGAWLALAVLAGGTGFVAVNPAIRTRLTGNPSEGAPPSDRPSATAEGTTPSASTTRPDEPVVASAALLASAGTPPAPTPSLPASAGKRGRSPRATGVAPSASSVVHHPPVTAATGDPLDLRSRE